MGLGLFRDDNQLELDLHTQIGPLSPSPSTQTEKVNHLPHTIARHGAVVSCPNLQVQESAERQAENVQRRDDFRQDVIHVGRIERARPAAHASRQGGNTLD